MFRPTNCVATFFTKSVNWEGKETKTDIGSYDCWNEEESVFDYRFPWMTARKTAKDSPLAEVAKGTLYVFDDIDVEVGDTFRIDEKEYSVVGRSKFTDCKGNFGHYELLYR